MAKAPANRVKAETLSLRVSPELKFGLELLARIEERSLTTQVERALKELFNTVRMDSSYLGDYTFSYPVRDELYFLDVLGLIYSVDSPTRLIRTAIMMPHTLSQRETAILRFIHDTTEFNGDDSVYFSLPSDDEELLDALTKNYFRNKQPLDMKTVRKNWAKINDVIDFALEHGHYPPDSPSWD